MVLLLLACDHQGTDGRPPDTGSGPADTWGDSTPACDPEEVYADTDGDGYLDWADCGCLDPTVHPDAEELENGVDDDCDGTIDEGAADVDADGWTTGEGDCDDGDPSRNPGVEEVSGDGLDANCDGSDASPAVSLYSVGCLWTSGIEGKAAGTDVAMLGDFDGGGVSELAVRASGLGVTTDSGDRVGATWVVPMATSGSASLEDAPFAVDDAGWFESGNAVVGNADDLDGDGVPELLIGQPEALLGEGAWGRLSIFDGAREGRADSTQGDTVIEGDYAGFHFAAVTDSNGDGLPELDRKSVV